MRIILMSLISASLLACGGSAKRSSELLSNVRAYNHGLRWEKLPQSAVRIPPKERDAFLDERESLLEELRIDDYEVSRVTMTSQQEATVQIKWTWHLDRKGIVRNTTSSQEWRLIGKRWLMLKESHVRGHEMPGIGSDEAEEAPQNASKADVEAALRTAENRNTITE